MNITSFHWEIINLMMVWPSTNRDLMGFTFLAICERTVEIAFFPQTVWPHWGVLAVGVKARCQVVSSVRDIFADRRSTNAPSSSVFDGRVSPETSRATLSSSGPLRSLSLRRSANFAIARATLSSLWAPSDRGAHFAIARATLLSFFVEILPRGPLQRSCQETSYRELVQRSC